MHLVVRLSALAILSVITVFAQESKPSAPAPPKRAGNMEKIRNSSAAKAASQQDAEREKQNPAPTTTQPTPATPEFEKLSKMFLGRWRTMEKHEPSPWLANGGQGSGMETVTYGPGRLSLLIDYRSSGAMGPFQGHGIMLWDPAAKEYRSVWTDSLGAALSTRVGHFDRTDLVLTGSDDVNGTKMDFREVYTDIKDSGFTFYMEMSPAGKKQWKRLMTNTYNRLDVGLMMGNRMRPTPQGRPAPPQPEDKKQ
jgi:hypothetical protein